MITLTDEQERLIRATLGFANQMRCVASGVNRRQLRKALEQIEKEIPSLLYEEDAEEIRRSAF